jgi:hypothetical protein
MQNVESFTSSSCGSAGGVWSLNKNMCYFAVGTPSGPSCQTGFTFSTQYSMCVKQATCNPGDTLDSTTGKCTRNTSLTCPPDSILNTPGSTPGSCTRTLNFPATGQCPQGFYQMGPTTCANNNPPICPAGSNQTPFGCLTNTQCPQGFSFDPVSKSCYSN